jgi:aminoglycoside phosphotransferase (APT) family kinase protein
MSTETSQAVAPALDTSLVRRLIAGRFPQWADLSLAPVASAGTANAMYRLGEDMVVRLPLTAGSARDVAKEHTWLPRLAPRLPVAVPAPLGQGEPTGDWPWPWSVYRWLDGHNPVPGRLEAPDRLAGDLAGFVAALRGLDPADGPAAYRGEPLAERDAVTREAVAELRGTVDGPAATAVWEEALGAPGPAGPVWIHSDLQPGNVLVARGRLSAVIDFQCVGLGDGAVDLIAAWYLLPAGAREVFRAAVGADDAAWARGRGWALSIAVLELRYYRGRDARMAAIAEHVVQELLRDHRARHDGGTTPLRDGGR